MDSRHHNYLELDDELPTLSLIGGVFMALIIALFSHARREKPKLELATAPMRVKVTRRPHH